MALVLAKRTTEDAIQVTVRSSTESSPSTSELPTAAAFPSCSTLVLYSYKAMDGRTLQKELGRVPVAPLAGLYG